jgi:hypothetical protein
MTYVECPHCGGKALNVATRCPQCGGDFPSRPLQRGAAERTLRLGPLLLAAAIVALVVVIGIALSRSGSKETSALAAIDTAPAATPRADNPHAATPRADSSGGDTFRDTPLPTSAPALSATPTSTAVPAPTTARRYARTWTHVRAAPTRASASTLVLDPGDAVQVDSLRRGWYRVLVDGRPKGYVHRSSLDEAPPSR